MSNLKEILNTTKIHYEHVLSANTTYDVYGINKVLKEGYIFETSNSPRKKRAYKMTLGHGNFVYFGCAEIHLVEVTTTITKKEV